MAQLNVGSPPGAGEALPKPPSFEGVEDGCWNCGDWVRVNSAIGRCNTDAKGFGVPMKGQTISYIVKCPAHRKVRS